MPLPAFLARLLVLAGVHRLFPSIEKRLGGPASSLRYWSSRLLTAPFDALGHAADLLAPDGPDAIDLAGGSPRLTQPLPQRIPPEHRGWPPAGGLPDLGAAVTPHPEAGALITNGAIGAVHTVLDAFTDAGCAVAVPDVTSPLFPLVLKGRGLRIRWVPSRHEAGQKKLDEPRLASALRGARLLILCSPCNPTGACYSPDDLARIAWWAAKRDTLVLSDESFAPLCHDDPHTPTAAFAPERTLTVGGVSKGHGLAWARVGWVTGPRHLINACAAAAALRDPFVPYPSQAAALAALEEGCEPTRQAIASRRGYVLDRLAAAGLHAAWPAAGFFAWLPIPRSHPSGHAFADALHRQARVRVVPGEMCGPGGAGHARLSFADDEGRLDEGLGRIADFTRRTRILALQRA